MLRFDFKKFLALALVSIALAACGGKGIDEEELKLLGENLKLNTSQQAAFRACAESSAGSTPYVHFSGAVLQMSKVPLEVCGCHSKVIAAVLKVDKLGSYAAFVKWIGVPDRKGEPKLKSKDFVYRAEPKSIGERLASSLDSCSKQYAAAHEKEAKKLLQPYVSKEQQKKDAEAKAAAKKKSST